MGYRIRLGPPAATPSLGPHGRWLFVADLQDPARLGRAGFWVAWLVWFGLTARRWRARHRREALLQRLPDNREAGAPWQVAWYRAVRAGLISQRIARGVARGDGRLVGCFDDDPIPGQADNHLPSAGLLGRFVGGASDIHRPEGLPGPLEVDAESRERTGGGGVGVGEGGEQQVVRPNRLRARKPGGLAERGVRGRRGAEYRLLGRGGRFARSGRRVPPQPLPDPCSLGRLRRQQVEYRHPDRQQTGVLLDHLSADSLAFPQHAKQDVLGVDVVVAQLERLTQRELKGLLRPRCKRDMARGLMLAGPHDGRDLLPGSVKRQAEAPKDPGRYPVTLG